MRSRVVHACTTRTKGARVPAYPMLKDATYEDLLVLPESVKAELIDGVIVSQSQPSGPHQNAAGGIYRDVSQAFQRRRTMGGGGDGNGPKRPGGWVILHGMELHLGPNVLVPDISGWLAPRMPHLRSLRYTSIVPDWVCEVLSPSTARMDRVRKMDLYGSAGVPHVWLVEPLEQFVEMYSLQQGSYRRVHTAMEDEGGEFVPFEAVRLHVGEWWPWD